VQGYIESVRELEEVKFQCAMELLKKSAWDFCFILFGATDWVSHLVYDQLITGNIHEDIASLYSDIDSYIYSLYRSVPSDTNVMIMSDHGFRVTRAVFSINTWLAQEGYLVKKVREREGQKKHRLVGRHTNAIDLTQFAWIARIPILSPLVTRGYRLLRQVIRRLGQDIRFGLGIDPEHTLAAYVSHESNGIYINRGDRYQDGIVSIERYENLRDELISKLSQITDPRTGERIFRSVRKAEEVYHGEASAFAPDIMIEPNDYYKLGSSYTRPNLFERTITNDHSELGILAGFGPVFWQGRTSTDASIMDLAPTILHCMGLPVPDSYDGRVLRNVLNPDSMSYKVPISYCQPGYVSGRERSDSALNGEEETLVLERLRGLGYLN
jgi:predicted AlkP superfamily phosphohydrolase/phosphomutase